MQEDEKEKSHAVGHYHGDFDHDVSKGSFRSPKVPLIPNKASKVAKVEGDERNQEVALLFVEEIGGVAHQLAHGLQLHG